MKNLIEDTTNQIESLQSDAYFYDMQILFITNLQKTSPEVEQAMDGETFDSIIETDKKLKEKILQQIAILNVKLKFNSDIADDVMSYNFHPTQKFEKQDDGSVIVKFKASGDKSIMWHVFKWGENVEILAPKELRQEYIDTLNSVSKIYKK